MKVSGDPLVEIAHATNPNRNRAVRGFNQAEGASAEKVVELVETVG